MSIAINQLKEKKRSRFKAKNPVARFEYTEQLYKRICLLSEKLGYKEKQLWLLGIESLLKQHNI